MVNEFQHKGYALLFGFIALLLVFLVTLIMGPFQYLAVFLIFLFLGVQIGTGRQPGRVLALAATLFPLWAVNVLFSLGKPDFSVYATPMILSLLGGYGGMWLAGRSPKGGAFVLQHLSLPLAVSLLGLLVATFLMFLATAFGWPWKQVPAFAVLLPVILTGLGVWLSRRAGRCWWRDTLLVWLPPFVFFVVYLPIWKPDNPSLTGEIKNMNLWMAGATIAGLLLTGVITWLVKAGKMPVENSELLH
ncbi:MAG: hypothetical protein EP344_04765 [Bacteroidetes bacterium]|nr:MAG: hypothetical protein EP344_04765 [Bacteroidota bacterium]